jgi:hypothetical protein
VVSTAQRAPLSHSFDQRLLNKSTIPDWCTLDRYKSGEEDAAIAHSWQTKRTCAEQWIAKATHR